MECSGGKTDNESLAGHSDGYQGAVESWLDLPENPDARRAGYILWLGLMLIIGFGLPTVEIAGDGDLEIVFTTINLLGEGGIPASVKFFALFPVLAGTIICALSFAARGLERSVVILALGLIPAILIVASFELRQMAVLAWGETGGNFFWLFLVSWIAWICILSGSRTLHYAPHSMGGKTIASAGGIAFFFTLILPVGPSALGEFPAVVPYRFLSEGVVFAGICFIAQQILTAAAAVLCILVFFSSSLTRKLGNAAFFLLLLGCMLGGFGLTIQLLENMVVALGEFPDGRQFLSGATSLLKGGILALGLVLILPVGLTDFMVNFSIRRTDALETPRRKLEILKDLAEEGILTDEEYKEKRREIVDEL